MKLLIDIKQYAIVEVVHFGQKCSKLYYTREGSLKKENEMKAIVVFHCYSCGTGRETNIKKESGNAEKSICAIDFQNEMDLAASVRTRLVELNTGNSYEFWVVHQIVIVKGSG